MKKLHTLAVILLLTIYGSGSELARSFKQARALGEALEQQRTMRGYIRLDLLPYYEQKYSDVFQSCLASTDHPDT